MRILLNLALGVTFEIQPPHNWRYNVMVLNYFQESEYLHPAIEVTYGQSWGWDSTVYHNKVEKKILIGLRWVFSQI